MRWKQFFKTDKNKPDPQKVPGRNQVLHRVVRLAVRSTLARSARTLGKTHGLPN